MSDANTTVNAQQNTENTNEPQEEMEQLDEETQKALKAAKFDTDYFSNSNQKKGSYKNQKQQKKSNNSKAKGKDFESYAKENGLSYNIQFEEDKAKRAERTYDNKTSSNNYESRPHKHVQGGSTALANNSQGQEERTNNYNNTENNKYRPKKFHNNQGQGGYQKNYEGGYKKNNFKNMTFSNKFDGANSFGGFQMGGGYMNQYNPMMMNEMMQLQQVYQNYQQMPNNMSYINQGVQDNNEPSFSDSIEKYITDCLTYYFSETNLNKDFFIRRNMNEEGYFSGTQLTAFNKLANHGITLEKMEEVVNSTDCSIESKRTNTDVLFRNKEWESFKNRLLPLEAIMDKRSKQQPNINFVNQQNNFYWNSMPQMMHPMMQGGTDMNMGNMGIDMSNIIRINPQMQQQQYLLQMQGNSIDPYMMNLNQMNLNNSNNTGNTEEQP